jgi:hypothetical protein
MPSTPPHWNGWPHTSQPEHTTIELENRLTTLEVHSETHSERVDQTEDRLNLHERVLLGILGVLYVLAQDKFPLLGAFIRGLGP